MMVEPGDKPPGKSDKPAIAGDRVATILRDIECPACGYNLRGLHGPIVDCPECGRRCDVPRMVAAQWTAPWWQAPGFNTVLMPTAWLLISFIAVVIVSAAVAGGTALVAVPLAVLCLAGVFVFLMWRAWKLFGGMRGVWLALLGHVILAGYGTGIVGVAISVVALLFAIIEMFDAFACGLVTSGMISGLLCLVCALLVWLCRRGERFIAGQCIRRYLAKRRGEVSRD